MAAYCKAKGFFEKHRDVPSFQGLDKECTELIGSVATELEARLDAAVRQALISLTWRDLNVDWVVFFML